MKDHHKTFIQGVPFVGKYALPSSYKVTCRLQSVNELAAVADSYDLIILDRDCTIQRYHGADREPEFEDILRSLAPKAELLSNSSIEEFQRIGDLYGDLFPVSKLVHLHATAFPTLLRIEPPGVLHQYEVDFLDRVAQEVRPSTWSNLERDVIKNYKKPDPKTVKAVVRANIATGRIPENPRVLMVGDRYLTDIVCGNLAGAESAIVDAYKPLSDSWDLVLWRIVDVPVGAVMSRVARQ